MASPFLSFIIIASYIIITSTLLLLSVSTITSLTLLKKKPLILTSYLQPLCIKSQSTMSPSTILYAISLIDLCVDCIVLITNLKYLVNFNQLISNIKSNE